MNIITTIAGKALVPASDSGDGGPATGARFYGPASLCIDNFNNIYIGDGYNCKIKKIDNASRNITTIAGKKSSGYSGDGGPATNAELFLPTGVKIDTLGNIYFADEGNNRIRKIDWQTGIISTIAGSGPTGVGSADSTGDGGPATNAQIGIPTGLFLDKSGNIYIADYGNCKVRKIDASTGVITTFAGKGSKHYLSGNVGYSGDGGLAIDAEFSGPVNLCLDKSDNLIICDQWNHAVRKVDAIFHTITTIAGNGTSGYFGDGGLAIHAKLSQPAGCIVDKENNIYIAEFGNGVVRKIDAVTGIITTVAGNGIWGYSGDGGPATAAELTCTDLVFDSYGCMIVADYGSNTIRKVYNPQLAVNTTKTSNELSVYPNPANDVLQVHYRFPGHEFAEFQITDVTGRVLTTSTLLSGKLSEQIDIRHLPLGLYLYRVLQDHQPIATGKFIKE